MKNGSIIRLLCILLACALIFSACGKDEPETAKTPETTKTEETAKTSDTTDTSEITETPEIKVTETVTAPVEEKLSFFTAAVKDADRMVQEAIEQYNAGDYSHLAEPVKYNVLWLGYTHVTYGDLDFRMTDSDRMYIQAVALNYEKSLESITDHNLDITVDLHFIDDETPLTMYYGYDWLYMAQETAQPMIDKYNESGEFDTVLTTIQTAGDENYSRNEGKEGFSINYAILGLCTAGMNSDMGYSTFDLQLPAEGTFPLEDPEIPSLYATSLAVHEWMHQLEYMGTLLGIEYPNTHAYMGPEEFPGYQEYINGENDYDFFEFYKLVLTGKLPYNDGDSVKYVGMYPKMWPLIKRNVFKLGRFTIKSSEGKGYLSGREEEPRLFLSDEPCVWNIKYTDNGRFVFTPVEMPDKLIDLGNAWDIEDNSISLWIYTGYVDAQSWRIIDNSDGSYSIQTPYDSGRLLTVRGEQGALLCSEGANGVQKWDIEPVR
ncbi:MAG: RICIN domain-containing protein [Lachnospiraceae bacterium]|nr:RICIN domain-containing protein [Lachnospiraceae bacterium]